MLEIHRGAPPPRWDDDVRALGGTLFQSTHWAAYLSRPGVEPWYLLERDGATTSIAALALSSRSGMPIFGRFLRSLSLTAHPCARGASPERVAAFMDACEKAARDAGCVRFSVESWMSAESSYRPGEHGYAEAPRVEFVVDLTAGPDALWKAMKKDQRERVRHLERSGMTVTLASERSDLDELRSMQASTQERRSRQGIGYDLEGDARFYDRVFERLVAPGVGRLFVARFEERPAAAIFFHAWNGRAYSMFSGSTPEGYRLGAQTLLYWRAVERFRAEGFTLLNRGGVPASAAEESDPLHGLYRFKTRLGATPVTCRSGSKVLRTGLAALLSIRERLRGPRAESHRDGA